MVAILCRWAVFVIDVSLCSFHKDTPRMEGRHHITKLWRRWMCRSRSTAVSRLYRMVERTTESNIRSLVVTLIFFKCQRMRLNYPNDWYAWVIRDEISMFEVQSLETKLPWYWKDGTTSVGSLCACRRMGGDGSASASSRTTGSLVILQLMVNPMQWHLDSRDSSRVVRPSQESEISAVSSTHTHTHTHLEPWTLKAVHHKMITVSLGT